MTQNFALYPGNKIYPPLEEFQAERKSFVDAAVAAGNDRLVTLTKAHPTHKHSQHSHSFSPYRCMLHGWVFCRTLIGSQTLPTLTLFLPLQVHGSWLFFLQSFHWKSDIIHTTRNLTDVPFFSYGIIFTPLMACVIFAQHLLWSLREGRYAHLPPSEFLQIDVLGLWPNPLCSFNVGTIETSDGPDGSRSMSQLPGIHDLRGHLRPSIEGHFSVEFLSILDIIRCWSKF